MKNLHDVRPSPPREGEFLTAEHLRNLRNIIREAPVRPSTEWDHLVWGQTRDRYFYPTNYEQNNDERRVTFTATTAPEPFPIPQDMLRFVFERQAAQIINALSEGGMRAVNRDYGSVMMVMGDYEVGMRVRVRPHERATLLSLDGV